MIQEKAGLQQHHKEEKKLVLSNETCRNMKDYKSGNAMSRNTTNALLCSAEK